MYCREIEHEDGSVTVEKHTPGSTEEAMAAFSDRWMMKSTHGPYTISTVFLAVGPCPYETMVFVGDSNADREMDRYSTRAEAIKGHHRISRKWRDIFGANLALLGEGFWEKTPPTAEL